MNKDNKNQSNKNTKEILEQILNSKELVNFVKLKFPNSGELIIAYENYIYNLYRLVESVANDSERILFGKTLADALKKRTRSDKSKKAANIRHSKPGGSRENKAKILAIWASGKYTSRDRCAEEECAALGMSFSTARKALRNTPDPTK